MMPDGMPGVLRERLGEAAAEGLVQFLNAREDYMTEAIAEAVGQTLEPRFAAIEAQLLRVEDRVTRTEDRVTAFEARVTAKVDAQFLALDAKLSRAMYVQLGSLTLFATFAGGLYLAFIAGS